MYLHIYIYIYQHLNLNQWIIELWSLCICNIIIIVQETLYKVSAVKLILSHIHILFSYFILLYLSYIHCAFLAATKQHNEWYYHLSVCLSHLFDYVPIIVSSWNFQKLLPMTEVTSMQRSRSKVKVTEVNTQLSRFWTVTPVWIHMWWWNDAQSLK